MFLKQSTASQVIQIGPFLDDTDFKTPETGLTIANTDIKLRKAGGTSHTNKNSGGATHIASGYYHATLDATDTNTVGLLDISVNVSGALPVWTRFYVLEEAVYDAMFGASALGYVSNAPVNVAQFGGVNLTATGGRPEVNTTHWGGTAVASARPLVDVAQISGDSAAADNLEAAADGTGYNLGGGSIVAASVTGAVGSVTGNVGGNVTGSVGSVASGGIAATSIADGALTAAKFAAGAFDAVWSVATRLLTAGTNIVLAKGTGVTGFNDLDAAGIRSAVGLASANLDTQLAAILDDTGEIGAAGAGLTEAGGTGDQFTAVLARLVALTVATGSVQDNVANTATAFETDLAETADHHWRDAFVLITSGALAGQVKRITAYDGTTKVLTVAGGFTAAPATAVTFAIINR